MQTKPLNPKQRRFLRLYLGRDERYHGNATECHMLAYDHDNYRTAQSSGSRLLAHPVISAEVDAWHKAQRDSTLADADFVLRQSIRLYDRAMGDEPIEVDVVDKVKDADGNTVNVLRTIEKREHNPAIARQALELIGRHTSVQAFQDNVEHTHTHRLEQALARRGKIVEAQAEQRVIEASATRIEEGDLGEGAAGEGEKKGCIEAEVISNGARDPVSTRAHSAGATGK